MQCSAECGRGQRTRQAICVDVNDVPLQSSKCAHLPQPPAVQVCDMGSCARTWFFTEWTQQVRAGSSYANYVSVSDMLTHIMQEPFATCCSAVTRVARVCTVALSTVPPRSAARCRNRMKRKRVHTTYRVAARGSQDRGLRSVDDVIHQVS